MVFLKNVKANVKNQSAARTLMKIVHFWEKMGLWGKMKGIFGENWAVKVKQGSYGK